jgi:hypothetical protein
MRLPYPTRVQLCLEHSLASFGSRSRGTSAEERGLHQALGKLLQIDKAGFCPTLKDAILHMLRCLETIFLLSPYWL